MQVEVLAPIRRNRHVETRLLAGRVVVEAQPRRAVVSRALGAVRAFTPGLLDQVYVRSGQKLLAANPTGVLAVDAQNNVAADRGGYVELDSDGHWWIPSGRIFLSPDTSDTAADELIVAQVPAAATNFSGTYSGPGGNRDPIKLPRRQPLTSDGRQA